MSEPVEEPRRQDTTDLMAQLFGSDDFAAAAEATAPPVHWPSLPADEIDPEMRALYDWVSRLQHRFREMVRLPACWYRHNGIVELLSALRDHERASYADTAAPTAALAWMMAFRDMEGRLRPWLAELRCGGELNHHDASVHAVTPPDTTPPNDLTAWIIEAEQARRQVTGAAAGAATHE